MSDKQWFVAQSFKWSTSDRVDTPVDHEVYQFEPEAMPSFTMNLQGIDTGFSDLLIEVPPVTLKHTLVINGVEMIGIFSFASGEHIFKGLRGWQSPMLQKIMRITGIGWIKINIKITAGEASA